MLTETPPGLDRAVGRGILAVAGLMATEGKEKRGRDMGNRTDIWQLSVSCGASVGQPGDGSCPSVVMISFLNIIFLLQNLDRDISTT